MITYVKYLSILYLLLSALNVDGQRLWLEVAASDSGLSLFDRVEQKYYKQKANGDIINFHQTVVLAAPIELELGRSTYAQCQFFSVYKANRGNTEGQLWKLSTSTDDLLINTDSRSADLTNGKFINYVNASPYKARISSYQHYRSDFEADLLTIGGSPRNKEIPVEQFQGSLAEFISFDRVLAPIAKQAVESYLAIKYSIPLAIGLDYVDNKGTIIWNYHKNRAFSHRVSGLGRNASFQLHQKQTQSEFGTGSIAFSLGTFQRLNNKNEKQYPDQSYLLWSDDDGEMDFEKQNGKPATLLRRWKVNRFGGMPDEQLQFELKHDGLANELDDDDHYWLVRGSEEDYNISGTSYTLLQKDRDVFTSDLFEPLMSDISYFTIARAPALFAHIDMTEVDCNVEAFGSINFKPIGGLAPYHASIHSADGAVHLDKLLEDTHIVTLKNLEAGQYTLRLVDGKGLSFEEIFYLNASQAIDLDLPHKLVLTDNNQHLHIKEKELIEYSWTSPSGETIAGANITFHESGKYLLTYGTEDCKSWHTLDVVKLKSNISHASVSPNPSSDGYFRFQAQLQESAPYTISVSSSDGMVWMTKQFAAAKYIVYEDWIPKTGTYFITLTTNGESRSEQLSVIH